MALAAVVESLDTVEETFRAHYKPTTDGKFILDVDVESHPATAGLRAAARARQEEKRVLEEELKKLKGIDPARYELIKELDEDELKELLELRTTHAGTGNGDGTGKKPPTDVEAEVARRTEAGLTKAKKRQDALEKENADLKQRNEELAARFNRTLIENELTTAASQSRVRPSAMEDVLNAGAKVFRLNDNGEVVAVGRDGNELYSSDGKTPLSPKEWLEQRQADRAHWFEPSGGGGAGGGGAGLPRKKKSDMSVTEKSQFIGKHGLTEYEQLPE